MSYNVICDVCGFKFKNDQLARRWDGLMVCEADYELRHPQDFIRSVHKDPYPLPYSRPRPADVLTGDTLNPATQTTIPTGTFTYD